MEVKTRGNLPKVVNSVDKQYLTLIQLGGQYLDVVLEGRRVYGLYNTGFNIIILLESLAKELGLPILPYEGTFCQAAGQVRRFIGIL